MDGRVNGNYICIRSIVYTFAGLKNSLMITMVYPMNTDTIQRFIFVFISDFSYEKWASKDDYHGNT